MTINARLAGVIVPILFLFACAAPATAVSRRTLREAAGPAVEIQASGALLVKRCETTVRKDTL